MRAPAVVPLDPLPDRRFRLGKVVKTVLPNTLLFQAAEESLDDPVSFGRVWSDQILRQSVFSSSYPEPEALEDQPVVASHHGSSTGRSQGSKTCDKDLLDGSFGLLLSTTKSRLIGRLLQNIDVHG